MSYSASAYSRVDKAWPSMSDSTQTRIQRLRELEQKRLEKQARMLEQQNSEPVPMPKFESGLKSSFQTVTYSNLDNVPKTENSGNIIDKIERNKKEVSAESVAPSEYQSAHSESVKVIDSPTKIDSIHEQSDGSKNTKVFVEPVRTLSTSFVSGPLSPTSAEKTKISVVRKMKLDSLPTVKTTSSDHVLGSKMSETESPVASKDISHTISENTDEKKDDIVLSKKSGMDLSVLPDGLEKGYSSLSREKPELVEWENKDEDSERKSQTCKPGENVCTGRSASITRDISAANKSENISSIAEELVSTCTTPVSSSNFSYMTCETKTIKSPTKPMTSDSEIALSSTISAESESATASGTKVTRENVEKGPIDTSKQSICAEGEKVNEAEGSSFRLGTLAMKQTLEVSAKIEEKFSSITDDVHSQMAKLEELQRQREERKKSPQEDELSHLSVRERFFRNQSIGRSSRNAKPQSIPEQIRASRLSRRNSENLIPRTNSPGKAAEAESPPTARRRSRLQQSSVDRLRRRTIDTVPALFSSSNVHDVPKERSKPMAVVDIDSLDKAFSRPDRERFSRLDELDRIRVQNREAVKRRDSAPSLVDAEDTGTLASRIDFPSSLIVNRGSSENIAQYPIHEHLETSFLPSRLITSSTEDVASRRRELLRSTSFDRPSVTSHSRSTLRPSYSESRLFPLDGGRLSHSGILSMSTDTEHSQLQQSNVQHSVVNEETDETPVYREGSPQGTPVIDPEGRTHWVAPASLRLSTYLSVMDRLENRNRSASFDSVPSYHHQPINLSNNLLDEINHDHFLANCFDKKYTLKERCALIREKIYGKSTKTERGKPDGASHETDNSKDKSEATLA